jgi:DNA repair exonuclease SbcCD nuclease subunit
MEFLAYSDIHHDDYKNGITLEDTIAIEDAITDYALNHGIKNVIFAGDWFRATNPTQRVIKEAEASWVRRSREGITTIVVVGNHDRFTKSETSGHAFQAARIFNQDLANVVIYDEIDRCKFEELGIIFLFVPAGWQDKLLPKYEHEGKMLIIILHGMIGGSMLASGISSPGISAESINNLNPSLVLAGDNHTPQNLPMFNCPAGYLGAPLQHGWGDRDQERGFWHLTIDNGTVLRRFSPTFSPRFVRANIPANNEIEAICTSADLLREKLDGRPGIVELTLIGSNVDNLNRNMIEENLRMNFDLREFKLAINQSYQKIEIVAGISEIDQPEDKWLVYVASGEAPSIEDMNLVMLSEMGKWAINEAKKI